jgi:methyl-accepting chemotaxis protein
MTSTETTFPSKKKFFEFKSIETKLTVIIVAILLVSGAALTGVSAFMAMNSLKSASDDSLIAAGTDTSDKFTLIADVGKDIVTLLSLDPEIQSALLDARDGTLTPEDQLAISEYITGVEETFSEIFDLINVLDNKGTVIASTTSSVIGQDYSQRDVFVNQQKGAYIGDPYLGTGNIPRIPYARPVLDENGAQIGLVYIAITFKTIEDRLFATPGLSDGAANFLVRSDGMVLSGVQGDYSFFLTKKFDLSPLFADRTVIVATALDEMTEYTVKTPVPGTSWSIITSETVDQVNGQIMDLVMMIIVSLIIVIIAGVIATAFIAKGFARPIQALTNNAKQLALGDVNVAITHVGADQIGQLADSFRSMTENTKQKVDAVQEIASGNVDFELTAASDKDMEGKALIQMKETLSAITASLDTLANQAAEGNLSYRADANKFQGVYRDLIETLNRAFDLIINPLHETMRLSTSYSSGDYSDRFDPDVTVKGDFIPFKAALDQIGINTSGALLKVRHGVHDISAGASQTSSSVGDVASAVATLTEGSVHVSSLADRNDAGLEQALIAMTDLADTVSEVAQRTSSVSELASQASDLAYDGVKRAELAGKGMEEVMLSSAEIAKIVSEMSSHMDEIGGIVDVISGIADQTSLLALNAAIEAARAGDAGLGFAVVADEVKALAQDSQRSAEHIGSIISNLQKMSVKMADGMETTSEVVQSGDTAVKGTIAIFQQMVEAIADVNRNMSEVAAASEEQAASVQEITASISEVRDMVQETAKQATDSAAAAEEISASVDEIKDTASESAQLSGVIVQEVNKFKIE